MMDPMIPEGGDVFAGLDVKLIEFLFLDAWIRCGTALRVAGLDGLGDFQISRVVEGGSQEFSIVDRIQPLDFWLQC